MLMGTALSFHSDKSVLQDVSTTNVNVSLTLNDIYFKDPIRMVNIINDNKLVLISP